MFTGVRPGELLAVKRSNVRDNHLVINQRVYRGKIDTPKTEKSNRTVAIPAGVQAELKDWLDNSPSSEWLWRIQKGKYQTGIKPALEKAGLGWVNFQVLRRTHSTLMRDLIDPSLSLTSLGTPLTSI